MVDERHGRIRYEDGTSNDPKELTAAFCEKCKVVYMVRRASYLGDGGLRNTFYCPEHGKPFKYFKTTENDLAKVEETAKLHGLDVMRNYRNGSTLIYAKSFHDNLKNPNG